MNILKKVLLGAVNLSLLTGCISTPKKLPTQQYCRITDVRWIEHLPKTPSKNTRTGLLAGTGTGAVVGGVIGGAAGVAAGTALAIGTLGIGAAAIPALAASGAAAGAGIGAGSGALGGSAVGYLYDRKQSSGKTLYEYKIECEKQAIYTVRKIQDKPFYVQEPVYLYWEKENMLIERAGAQQHTK